MTCPLCGSEKVHVRYLYGPLPSQDSLLNECEACKHAWQDKVPNDHEPIRYNKYFNFND